jgi:hypothetical protein
MGSFQVRVLMHHRSHIWQFAKMHAARVHDPAATSSRNHPGNFAE